MTEDNTRVLFQRCDELRAEHNSMYKRLADVDARVSSQERMTQQVMASIADHRAELKKEMAELKTELGRQVGEVLGVTQAIHKELKETREKHERELITVKERHDAVIDVVKADVADVRNKQSKTEGGIDMAKWLIEGLKVTAAGGSGALAAWLALNAPGV